MAANAAFLAFMEVFLGGRGGIGGNRLIHNRLSD